ncbi:MAG: alkaline phosphatase family protein [Acidimicrobiales bacterium]
MRRVKFLIGVAVLLGALGVVSSSSGADRLAKIPPSAPCAAPGATHYQHVVWILLENVGYSVVGSPSAPYFNRLTKSCGLATNDVAVAHPSLPNYIALTSGSVHGITDDGEPASHPLAVANLFSELGTKWRSLVESMPARCDHVTSGEYAARHNPAVYYTNLGPNCARNDVPLRLPLNLSAAFTLIVPNVCNDMHSCALSVGDAWLRRIVPSIVASAQYQARSLALFITFDESDTSGTNQIPTVVVAPSVPRGLRVAVVLTHYSLLRTTESLLHVRLLGGAKSARSMIAPFHL